MWKTVYSLWYSKFSWKKKTGNYRVEESSIFIAAESVCSCVENLWNPLIKDCAVSQNCDNVSVTSVDQKFLRK